MNIKNNISIKKRSFKLSILHYLINNIYQKNVDFSKLILNYSEVLLILNSKERDIIYLIYMNKFNIHKILYNEDKNIYININEENTNLLYYFFLILLIYDNFNIINYIYSIGYIEHINKFQNIINPNYKIKKIIILKIII